MSVTGTARRTVRRASGSTTLEFVTRAGFIGYGLLHLAIAWLAIQIATGRGGDNADQSGAFRLPRQQPAGRLVLILVAIGLAAMALWQLLLAGQVGYLAKGVAFAIAGILILDAALADSAARSRGLDGALRTLAGEPFGGLLLGIIAAGFAVFGVYCFAQAKYRKI